MTTTYAVIGFLASIGGWLILIYAGHRNQRAAKDSPLVDKTNFGPRLGAVVETTLHPDRAATWWREANDDEISQILNGTYYLPHMRLTRPEGVYMHLVKVFPALGQDSSEQYGIRPDDGEAT